MRIGHKVEMRSIKSKDGSSSYGDSKTSGKDVMMLLDGQSSSSGATHEKLLMMPSARSGGEKRSSISGMRSNSSMSDKGSVDSFKSGDSGTIIRRLNQ